MHKREISRGIALFLLLGGLIVLLFLHFSYAQQAILKEVNISVLDSTTPVVKSLFPPNATAIEAGSILFQYNATDYQWSNITNCSLVINNTVNITTTNTSYYSTPYAMLGNITRNMTALLEIGNYEWYVNCSEHRDPQFDDATVSKEGRSETFYLNVTVIPLAPFNLTVNISINASSENVTLMWPASTGATEYRVYMSASPGGTFSLYNVTTALNFTDENVSAPERYYKIAAVSALGENVSSVIAGKYTYHLGRLEGSNTKNWVSFPLNHTSFIHASDLLNTIPNVTSIIRWNATNQSAVTCNRASCPDIGCTDQTCYFLIEPGIAYEVNINGSGPVEINWTMGGVTTSSRSIDLYKITGTNSRNWITIPLGSSVTNAQGLINAITKVSVVRMWNASSQATLSRVNFRSGIGQNFGITPYRGVDIIPTQNYTWQQS